MGNGVLRKINKNKKMLVSGVLVTNIFILIHSSPAMSLTGDLDVSRATLNGASSPPALPDGDFSEKFQLTLGFRPDYERLEISPVFADGNASSLALLQSQVDFLDLTQGRIDISTFLKRKVIDTFGDLPLGVKEIPGRGSQNDGISYQFSIGNIPLCQFKVRFHRFQNGDVTAMGLVPKIDYRAFTNAVDASNWPDLSMSTVQITDAIEREDGGYVSKNMINPEKCYTVSQGQLIASWKFLVQYYPQADSMGNPRTDLIIADDKQVFKREAFDFDVTGKAKVYPFNPVKTPTFVQESLENLTGDGTLTSDILTSSVSPPLARVQVKDHDFSFNPDSLEFGEVSAFTHATKHLKYLISTGFQWYGLKPLKISVYVSTLKNNARFIPQIDDNTPGQIDVGTSDGKILRNLELDSDVVSHEVGHFVIYRTVRSTSGESLVLHEGLADYFAFARSNDACLAESICPADSLACIKPGECLRSGENSLKFNDETWKQWFDIRKSLNHLHGQIISGLLWDLRGKQIAAQSLDQLVMTSINTLPEDADFSHFLLALASADRSLFGGVNYTKLEKAARDRNLGNRFPSTGSTGGLSKSTVTESQVIKDQLAGQTNGSPQEGSSPGSSTTTRRSSGGSGSCAVIALQASGNTNGNINFLILFLLPFLAVFCPVKKAARSFIRTVVRKGSRRI